MSTDGREPQQVWLAGEDGPPGMITPAEPRQDAVYHPENIPGSRDAMPRPRQAAVDTALAASDLVLQYRDATAIGLERMELWARRLIADAGSAAAVRGDVTTLEIIWDRIRHAVGSADATIEGDKIAGRLGGDRIAGRPYEVRSRLDRGGASVLQYRPLAGRPVVPARDYCDKPHQSSIP